MANLIAPRELEFVGPQREASPRVATNTTYFKGGFLVLKPTTGFAAKPTDVANEEIAGIVTGIYEDGVRDGAFVVPNGPTPRARLLKGKVWIPVAGAVIADVGDIHFAADDQTMTKTPGLRTVGYRAQDFKPGFLLFDFNQPDRIA